MTTKKRLNAVKGLSDAKIEKIKEIAGKLAVISDADHKKTLASSIFFLETRVSFSCFLNSNVSGSWFHDCSTSMREEKTSFQNHHWKSRIRVITLYILCLCLS